MNKKVLYGVVIAMAMVIGGLGTWIVTDNLNDKETEKIENSKQQESLSVEEKMVNDIQDAFFSDSDAVVTYSEKDEDVSIIVTAKSSEMLSNLEDEAVWKKTYKPLMEKVSKYVADDYGSKYKVKLSKPKSEGKEYLLILANGSIQEDFFPYTKEKEVVEEKQVESGFSAEEEMVADVQHKFFKDNDAIISYEKLEGLQVIVTRIKSQSISDGVNNQDQWEEIWEPYFHNLESYILNNYGSEYEFKVLNLDNSEVSLSGGFFIEPEFLDSVDNSDEVTNAINLQFSDIFDIDPLGEINGALSYYLFVKQDNELYNLFTPMYNLDYDAINHYWSGYTSPIADKLKGISNSYPDRDIEVSIISPTNLKDIVTCWRNGKIVYDMFE